MMRRRDTKPRAQQQQDILRDLASDGVSFGREYSRAAEAVEALQRIREGTYGTCTDCAERIPAARLEVKPEATRCIACQTEYEQRSVSYADGWRQDVA